MNRHHTSTIRWNVEKNDCSISPNCKQTRLFGQTQTVKSNILPGSHHSYPYKYRNNNKCYSHNCNLSQWWRENIRIRRILRFIDKMHNGEEKTLGYRGSMGFSDSEIGEKTEYLVVFLFNSFFLDYYKNTKRSDFNRLNLLNRIVVMFRPMTSRTNLHEVTELNANKQRKIAFSFICRFTTLVVTDCCYIYTVILFTYNIYCNTIHIYTIYTVILYIYTIHTVIPYMYIRYTL